VRDHWQPEDRIATPLPAISYVALNRCDYFVALDNPFLWQIDTGPVDPHLGLPWIGTVEGVRWIASQSPRLWIVVEERYATPYPGILGDRLTTPFQQLDYVVYLVQGMP
jgi:hypothetical protein